MFHQPQIWFSMCVLDGVEIYMVRCSWCQHGVGEISICKVQIMATYWKHSVTVDSIEQDMPVCRFNEGLLMLVSSYSSSVCVCVVYSRMYFHRAFVIRKVNWVLTQLIIRVFEWLNNWQMLVIAEYPSVEISHCNKGHPKIDEKRVCI